MAIDPISLYMISTALGMGANELNKKAEAKELKRVEALQEKRRNEESQAKLNSTREKMDARQRADSIRDQEYRIRDDKQAEFAQKLQKFDIVNKSKDLKAKQGERIGGQNKVIEQAREDGKLRAGSNVKGNVSGTFTKGSSAGTGQVVSRANKISELMGRLSGTNADLMREGGILSNIGAQGQAMQSRIAGFKADADREIRMGNDRAAQAGWLPEAEEINYDPSSTWGRRLGIASKLVGLYSMGQGAGMWGNNMSQAGAAAGSMEEVGKAFELGDPGGLYGAPINASASQISNVAGMSRYPSQPNMFGDLFKNKYTSGGYAPTGY